MKRPCNPHILEFLKCDIIKFILIHRKKTYKQKGTYVLGIHGD